MENLNITQARCRLSELISRAASGERFIIQRRGHPVAVLIGVKEVERHDSPIRTALGMAQALGQDKAILDKIEKGELHPAMAAFGLWRDVPDMTTTAR